MSRRAVIGLGNTLRRDDGIGILVLDALKAGRPADDAIEYLSFGTASFDLIHRFEVYDTVLLIDGIKAPGLEPGALIIKPIDQLNCTKRLAGSTHELHLCDLFELAQKLNITTIVHVAGIQVQDVSYEEGLTEPLARRFDAIVRDIRIFIQDVIT